MKKGKTPGRIMITCVNCGRAQSTHSSNRTQCHSCSPKATRDYVPTPKASETAGTNAEEILKQLEKQVKA